MPQSPSMRLFSKPVGLLSAVLMIPVMIPVLVACSPEKRAPDSKPSGKEALGAAIESAISNLTAKSGSEVKGVVTFRTDGRSNGLLVNYEISGLAPGKHGFHIHDKGDCSSQDGKLGRRAFQPRWRRTRCAG